MTKTDAVTLMIKDKTHRKKILIVDDSPTVIAKVQHQLSKAGYEVVAHTTGLGTMVTILRERPELILLDIEMPLLDGSALCALLKSNSAMSSMSHIPVIFFSSKNEAELQEITSKSGAQGYVNKNADINILIDKIDEILQTE